MAVLIVKRLGADHEVLLDDADMAWASAHVWYINQHGYAIRYPEPGQAGCLMHRDLLGLKVNEPERTDHRNRNRLDNRRGNLRVATAAENMQNIVAHQDSRYSAHRGVTFDKRHGYWIARFMYRGREQWAKFDTESEAASAAAAMRAAVLVDV